MRFKILHKETGEMKSEKGINIQKISRKDASFDEKRPGRIVNNASNIVLPKEAKDEK